MPCSSCICSMVRAALLNRRVDSRAAIALAVSGGPDSMALLYAAAHATRGKPCARACVPEGTWRPINAPLRAVTVDHCLRPESEAEAKSVRLECSALGIQARTESLALCAGAPRLTAALRLARYCALHSACVQLGARELWTAHQQGTKLCLPHALVHPRHVAVAWQCHPSSRC
jgi:tRNA(Ile)-lysidine synthase